MDKVNSIKKAIIRPLISEKSLNMIDKFNKYSFIVSNDINKIELTAHIEKIYSVKVLDVTVINVSGKIVRFGKKRIPGRRGNFKKAFVTLKKGDKIDLFEIKS
jgi:large subunit ribosomal protein L23